MRKALIILLFFLVAPIIASAVKYLFGDRSADWQSADRSSAGLLPSPAEHPDALVRVYAARTVRWRGIFAVHSWIVVKERNAPRYTRYDYTAWGEPIRINGFAPDGRWFGGVPDTIAAADGEAASRMIPKIRAAVLRRRRNCGPRCRRPRSARTFLTTVTYSGGRHRAPASASRSAAILA